MTTSAAWMVWLRFELSGVLIWRQVSRFTANPRSPVVAYVIELVDGTMVLGTVQGLSTGAVAPTPPP
jgi:hypothetical protein